MVRSRLLSIVALAARMGQIEAKEPERSFQERLGIVSP